MAHTQVGHKELSSHSSLSETGTSSDSNDSASKCDSSSGSGSSVVNGVTTTATTSVDVPYKYRCVVDDLEDTSYVRTEGHQGRIDQRRKGIEEERREKREEEKEEEWRERIEAATTTTTRKDPWKNELRDRKELDREKRTEEKEVEWSEGFERAICTSITAAAKDPWKKEKRYRKDLDREKRAEEKEVEWSEGFERAICTTTPNTTTAAATDPWKKKLGDRKDLDREKRAEEKEVEWSEGFERANSATCATAAKDLWRKEKRDRKELERTKEEAGRREEGRRVGRSSRRVLEGHKEGEVRCVGPELVCVSGSPGVAMVGGTVCRGVEGSRELVDHGMVSPLQLQDDAGAVYTSDEWEESALSDSDTDDHSDSSDDDDPKSQVDRLIEQVTLVYLDGENSNLSSESEDYDDSDSESDITDVSPLISATASPLGLSPVLPRRALGTSPLALHDNKTLGFEYGSDSTDQNYGLKVPSDRQSKQSRPSFTSNPSDMTVLLKAVVELEENQRREQSKALKDTPSKDIPVSPSTAASNHPRRSPPMAIHPIDASPHHRHLRRAAGHRRKNMSFPNDEVRRIDRDNQILLEKIMNTHTRTSTRHPPHHHHHHHHSTSSSSSSNQSFATHHHHHHSHSNRPLHRPANATVNRRREEEKIRRENMILLRKIQEAKPSREVTAFRNSRHHTHHHHHHHHHHRATQGLSAAPPGSCGASARTAQGHVTGTAARRKETAL